jgi:membrane protease YdiL (CAAX protease family)
MPGVLDHLIVFGLVVASPIYNFGRAFPALRAAIARGEPHARRRFYLDAIISQWVITGAVAGLWWRHDRPWSALGLGTGSGWQPWIGTALAAVMVTVLLVQVRAATAPSARASLVAQLQHSGPYLPHTRPEVRRWLGVSVTAGICEELLCRGFLVWYLDAWLPLAAAIPVAAVCFAVPHLWAGRQNALQAGVLALVWSGLFLVLGSLWAAMVIHAAIDITSGWIAYRVLSDEPLHAQPAPG